MFLETDLLSPNVNALENKSEGSTDSVNNILIFCLLFFIYKSLFSRTRIICGKDYVENWD